MFVGPNGLQKAYTAALFGTIPLIALCHARVIMIHALTSYESLISFCIVYTRSFLGQMSIQVFFFLIHILFPIRLLNSIFQTNEIDVGSYVFQFKMFLNLFSYNNEIFVMILLIKNQILFKTFGIYIEFRLHFCTNFYVDSEVQKVKSSLVIIG